MKRMIRSAILVAGTGMLLSSAPAQDMMPLQGRPAEKLEQFKKVRLMEVMKLDEETSVRFMARYNKQLDDLRQIGEKRMRLLDELDRKVHDNASDDALNKTIGDVLDLENQVARVRRDFVEGLKDMLTAKQVATYIVFERDFNRNLRDALRDMNRGQWERRMGR